MSTWKELKENPRLKDIFNTRIAIVKLIREFFWSQDFKETETPIAVRYASQEPYLNPIPVTIHDTRNTTHKMYLRTSPEYSLKKLLAAGYEKIFEFSKCFRDYESFGRNHNTEFTMLEWYRSTGTYQNFMDDMEKMFKYVGERLKIKDLRLKDCKIKIDQTWERLSMKEAWKKYTQVDLDNNLTIEQLSNTAKAKGYKVDPADAYEDIFFRLFLNEIEPKLGLERPIFIYDYPAQMTSLSRLCEHDNRYAERVECYIGGLELCNGFGELTDAEEQKKRLEGDRKLREKLGKEIWPIDEDFISALRSGIGTASGVAMGVDRMVVLFTGAKDISEVMFGSMKDQLGESK